jgi:hypothetical protein
MLKLVAAMRSSDGHTNIFGVLSSYDVLVRLFDAPLPVLLKEEDKPGLGQFQGRHPLHALPMGLEDSRHVFGFKSKAKPARHGEVAHDHPPAKQSHPRS